MEHVRSFDGTRIAYTAQGSGPAVLLLHGFAADHVLNWGRPGVIDALTGAGRRVDRHRRPGSRRVGQATRSRRGTPATRWCATRRRSSTISVSSRSTSSATRWASMVAARLVPDEPRTRALVLGGVGATVAPPRTGGRAPEAIAAALLADDPASIENVAGKAFREFADATGADRQALGRPEPVERAAVSVRFDAITVPTLVVVGRGRHAHQVAGRARRPPAVRPVGDGGGRPPRRSLRPRLCPSDRRLPRSSPPQRLTR